MLFTPQKPCLKTTESLLKTVNQKKIQKPYDLSKEVTKKALLQGYKKTPPTPTHKAYLLNLWFLGTSEYKTS